MPVVVTEVKKRYVRCELAGSKEAITFLFPQDVTAGFLPATDAKKNKKCRKSTEASQNPVASVAHVVLVEEDEESIHVVTTGSPKRVIRSFGKHMGTDVAQTLALAAATDINKPWKDLKKNALRFICLGPGRRHAGPAA